MVIYEKRTVNNVKTNGEIAFFKVVKKMIPNENGTTLPAVSIGVWDSITSSEGLLINSAQINATPGKNNIELKVQELANGMYHLMLFDSKGNSHVEQVMVSHSFSKEYFSETHLL